MSQVMKEEQPVYHRILLKLSGESLGANGQSIDPDILSRVAGEITGCIELGVQVALVIGGGNIYRGAELEKAGLNRVIGDQMGMLATVMNGLAMADALHHFGVHSTLMCAVEIEGVAKRFNWNDGRRALNDGVRAAPETLSSPPIPRPASGAPSSACRRCSRAPALTACTPPILRRTAARFFTRSFPLTRFSGKSSR